jgi:CPA2 family monovalent cation:H+ antiporter-2
VEQHLLLLVDPVEQAGEQLGLLDDIAIALAFSLVCGLLATRLRLSPIVGYLAAGIAIGPYTPGFIGDVHHAEELGQIGVVFLMFGVGLHFSLRDLVAVRNVAVPGAVIQSLLATLLTVGVAGAFGWGLGPGLVLGLAVSVASTVVLVRALMARDALDTQGGRVAVGWLVVEDLFSALVLVLLPVLAASLGGAAPGHTPDESITRALMTEGDSVTAFASRQMGVAQTVPVLTAITFGNVALVVALMLSAGQWVVSWLMDEVERTGSDELLTLAVVVVALLVAVGTSAFFGMSVALGAFFAGIVAARTRLAHRVGEDVRPLRDLFGVLFFASVGMLFDPATPLRMPGQVLAILLVIMVAKPLIAGLIVLGLRQPRETALTVAPGLGQIGEFSFILATVGRATGLLPDEAYQLIITGSIVSIALNPLLFRAAEQIGAVRHPAQPVPAGD